MSCISYNADDLIPKTNFYQFQGYICRFNDKDAKNTSNITMHHLNKLINHESLQRIRFQRINIFVDEAA